MSFRNSESEITRALATMRGKRALLVGDFMLDAYVYGETVRVSREAPVLVVRRQSTEHRLGGAANTAANLIALGVQTTVVGSVGNDEAGRVLSGMLSRLGADVVGLKAHAPMTAVKTRILAGASGTSKQQVLRLDDEPDAQLNAQAMAVMAADLTRLAANADIIVVSDYGMGALGAELIATVCQLAREGSLVCVDSRYQLPEYVGVTAVTPNTSEAEGAVGFSLGHPGAVERAGRHLLESLRCQASLITQGRHGMTLFRPDQASAHVEIVGDDEVTDVTGAGDTVIATFSAALAAGLGMDNGMRLANCAAGIVVTKVGTVTATPAEISAAAVAGGVELLSWDK